MRQDTFIYFIATVDRSMVKIGCSCRPQHRMASFKTSSPLPLEIIASAPGTMDDERAIHAKFVTHHSHGEWFRGCPEIFVTAAVISQAGSLPTAMLGSPGRKNPLNNRGAGKKRTPEMCKKMGDGLRLAHARRQAAYEAACQNGRHQLRPDLYPADRENSNDVPSTPADREDAA